MDAGARDRAAGAIVGLALGDALGAPFEFRRAHEIPSSFPAFDLPWMGLEPGSWTDDTAMARNLWTSLIGRGGELDLDDVRRRHLAWIESSPPDVGVLTMRVLRGWAAGEPDPARAYVDERGPEVSAGNGSVMYCAPLGVVRANEPARLHQEAPMLSALTHWDHRCRTACLAVTLAVAALVRGERGEPAVVDAVEAVSGREGDEELAELVDGAGIVRPIDGPDRGFVFFTAGVALRQAAKERPFEEGLREVVALGGDTDTNAAVTGALLGAFHGRASLPRTWLGKLVELASIDAEAVALAELI